MICCHSPRRYWLARLTTTCLSRHKPSARAVISPHFLRKAILIRDGPFETRYARPWTFCATPFALWIKPLSSSTGSWNFCLSECRVSYTNAYFLSVCLNYNSSSDEWSSELASQVWTAFRNGIISWHINRPRYGLTALRNTFTKGVSTPEQ